MMKHFWSLPKDHRYESKLRVESKSCPGVSYSIRKISLKDRLELIGATRKLAEQYPFLQAGNLSETLESREIELAVDRLYLEWGLIELSGLVINGRRALPKDVFESAPASFSEEILASIQEQLTLSESERKNS